MAMGRSILGVLLVAALTLTAIVRQYLFVHGWLTVKVVLLVVYVVLGSLALKRGKTPARPGDARGRHSPPSGATPTVGTLALVRRDAYLCSRALQKDRGNCRD
jgi:hypothetical protein